MIKLPKLNISVAQIVLLLSFIFLLCAELAYFALKLQDNPQLSCILFYLFAFGLVAVLAIFGLLKIPSLNVEIAFLICLLIIGAGYITVIGPMKSNDETSHYITAYWLSNLFFGLDTSSVQMRADDIEFFNKWNALTMVHAGQFAQLQEGFSWTAANEDLTTFIEKVNRTPFNTPIHMHLFPALGITIGRIFGLGAVPSYYLGRILTLIAFSLVVYIAVRNTPIGKPVFMIVALLPLTIELASSFSYDGPTIAVAMLLTAFTFKAIYADKQTPSTLIIIAISSLLLVPMKVVYSSIILLVLLIPTKSFPSKFSALFSILYKTLLLIGCFFTFTITQLDSAMSIMQSDASNYSVRESYRAYSVNDLIEQPAWAANVFLNSFFERLDFKIFTYLGAYLGQVNLTPVGGDAVSLAFFTLLLFAFMTKNTVPKPKWILPALGIVCFLLTSAALDFTMYVGNAEYGTEVLIGVLGRYFIPVTPLLIPLFANTKLSRDYPTPKILLYGAFCVNIFYIIDTFGFIALAQPL